MHKKNIQGAFICPYCLKTIPWEEHSIDHEPPKSRQAELGPSKLVLCCKKCNSEKGALTTQEYEQWKKLNALRVGQTKNLQR